MWGKSEQVKSVPGASSSPDPSTLQPNVAMHSNPSSPPAMVTEHIKIKGEISGRGDFYMDGELEGKVYLTDGTFTVGPNARVTAEIEARQIIVGGEVVGSLKAHDSIKILSTGKATGEIDTHGIIIEEGAVLHGQVATLRAAVNQTAAGEVPPEELAEGVADQSAQTPRTESSRRAKGAAAGGVQPNPQKS